MMSYEPCPGRNGSWPSDWHCILAAGHLDNLAPADPKPKSDIGPHVPNVSVPAREVRYPKRKRGSRR